MGKIIGYAKLGRSMPLTLDKCGNLGGDVEMVAVVKELALRHPEDTFVLVGRNSGELPENIGLPDNVFNPWSDWRSSTVAVSREYGRFGWPWKDQLKDAVNYADLKGVVLTPEKQLKLAEIFDGITAPFFDEMDAMVMWVGQHGTSNTPIPKVDDPTQLTKPQDWCAWYSGFLLRGINRWRDVDPWNREEICLNADARNRHKMRDMKWPLRHPILAQYKDQKRLKHHRYGDPRDPMSVWGPWHMYADQIGHDTWISTVYDAYARLEVNGLRPGTPFGDLISYDSNWVRPGHFGLFINEARSIGVRPAVARRPIMKEWVLPLDPYFIHGTWSQESMNDLGRRIAPAPWKEYYPSLHSVRTTFTTPSSGSGWATAKPWEAFAAGTVCFFHPEYDTQDNILKDAPYGLYEWLRVTSPEVLKRRIEHLNSQAGQNDWHWIVQAQRMHFDKALEELTYMKMIEERLYP